MQITGACGDTCNACPRYSATVNNSRQELEAVKNLWVRLGWRHPDIDADELRCSGCRDSNNCGNPELRDCVFSRNLENCGFCQEFPFFTAEKTFQKAGDMLPYVEKKCTLEEKEMLIQVFFKKEQNLKNICRQQNK